jgi:hypothetical protein
MKKLPLYFVVFLLSASNIANTEALTLNPNPSLDTSVDAEVDSKASGTDIGVDAEGNANTSSTNQNSTAIIKVTDNIKVERDEIDGASDTTEIIDSGSVITSADLAVYARSIILSDKNIKEVNFEKDKVEITYQKEGKVIGLFKTKYDIEVKVDSNGRIEVDYPWFAALIKGSNKPKVRQRMEKEVSVFLDKNTNATGEIELNAAVEAKLANLIHTILVEELNGGMTQSVGLNASTTNR